MLKLILLILSILHSSHQSMIVDDYRVIDGSEARPHSRAFQAGIRVWRGQEWWETLGVCGGSLVSSNFVLTSGFCLHNSNRLQVILGAHQLFENESTQQRFDLTSNDYIRHPKFLVDCMCNDIALLRLPRSAIFNSFVQPIDLPSSDFIEKNLVGERIEVAGWGRFSDWTQDFSPVLRFSKNTIADASYCASKPLYRLLIHKETMCVETLITNSSPCNGDHGSAVTWSRDSHSRKIIVGVFSFGKWWWNFGCKPGGIDINAYASTDIRPYVEWIREVIRV